MASVQAVNTAQSVALGVFNTKQAMREQINYVQNYAARKSRANDKKKSQDARMKESMRRKQ